MGKNIVAIAGVETIRSKTGKVLRYSDTFLDNMLTYRHENPKDNIVIVDARAFLANPTATSEDVWKDVCSKFDKIDKIIYAGHSSDESLIVFSHTKTEMDIEQRYWRSSFHYNAPYADDAEIIIYGCQAGGKEGKKWPVCIAQTIANKTGKVVWAFVSKSYQIEKPKGHYRQKSDDKVGLVKFTKEISNVS
jgi:hypothetical protein